MKTINNKLNSNKKWGGIKKLPLLVNKFLLTTFPKNAIVTIAFWDTYAYDSGVIGNIPLNKICSYIEQNKYTNWCILDPVKKISLGYILWRRIRVWRVYSPNHSQFGYKGCNIPYLIPRPHQVAKLMCLVKL